MGYIYRVGDLTFGILIGYKKHLWIFFQKYGFIRKIEPFHLTVVGNFPRLMKFGYFHAPKSWSLLHLLN